MAVMATGRSSSLVAMLLVGGAAIMLAANGMTQLSGESAPERSAASAPAVTVTTREYVNDSQLEALVSLEMRATIGAAEIDTTNPHSWVRHGLAEVQTVRNVMAAEAQRNVSFFNRPPFRDGRMRYVAGMSGGEFAVWILEPVADGLREVTAFVTRDQGYVNKVRDDCGSGGWFGHAYGG